MGDARAKEKEFFTSRPEYADLQVEAGAGGCGCCRGQGRTRHRRQPSRAAQPRCGPSRATAAAVLVRGALWAQVRT
jgi:hypothetical protein